MDVYAQNGVTPLPVIKTERLELRPMILSDVDHVVEKLNNLIISSHFTENAGSQNVLQKLGFIDVGSHVHHSVARGEDVPGRSMELSRARWESLQNA